MSSLESPGSLGAAAGAAAPSRATPERFRDRALDLTVDFLWRLAQQQNESLKAGSESGEPVPLPTSSAAHKVQKLNLHLTDVRLGKVHTIRNVSPASFLAFLRACGLPC